MYNNTYIDAINHLFIIIIMMFLYNALLCLRTTSARPRPTTLGHVVPRRSWYIDCVMRPQP